VSQVRAGQLSRAKCCLECETALGARIAALGALML